MNLRAGRAALAGILIAGAGCTVAPQRAELSAPRDGRVGAEDLSATIATSARLTLAENENFLPPLPKPGNALPDYPSALLDQRLPPQSLCLRVGVDAAGAVSSSAPFAAPPDCTAPERIDPRFYAAAQQTVAAWRFDPAVRCVFEQGDKPDFLTCVGAREIPQAVSLTYRFVFSQHNGKGWSELHPSVQESPPWPTKSN